MESKASWKNIADEQPEPSEIVAVIKGFGTVNERFDIARWIGGKFVTEYASFEGIIYWHRLPPMPEGAYESTDD